jgi:fused signal recognition particle receptor
MLSFLKKLKTKITSLFSGPIDEATLDQLEKLLYEADIGSTLTPQFIAHIKAYLRKNSAASSHDILSQLKLFADTLLSAPPKTQPKTGHPLVFLIVGINGSGKTTSIAKLAHHFKAQGKTVLLAAADTFRAGAITQLATWAKRLDIDIVKSSPGSDPSSVVFDALTSAKSRSIDIVLIDTAGRLQNKTDLMQELAKIDRTCQKVLPGSPHETLLVLDATLGQNGIEQAQTFHALTPLTGILLAKLDGTAKGGAILPIYHTLGIPIRWIGIGEKPTDLAPFNPSDYTASLFKE